MAYRGRKYLVSSKKTVLAEIEADLKESQKQLGIRLSTYYVSHINKLKVTCDNQHAEETMWETIQDYRDEGHFISVENSEF